MQTTAPGIDFYGTHFAFFAGVCPRAYAAALDLLSYRFQVLRACIVSVTSIRHPLDRVFNSLEQSCYFGHSFCTAHSDRYVCRYLLYSWTTPISFEYEYVLLYTSRCTKYTRFILAVIQVLSCCQVSKNNPTRQPAGRAIKYRADTQNTAW